MKKLLITLLMISNISIGQVLEWGTTIGASETEHARKVKTDGDGNVYITGYFTGTTDFDPSGSIFELTSSGTEDIFVLKLDADGNFIWAKSMGGAQYDQARNLAIDGSGNVFITGFFEGVADFDPGPGELNLSSNGSNDMFIVKLTTDGNLVWATNIGGDLWDSGSALVTDSSGNALIFGDFQGTVDFDPGNGVFNVTTIGVWNSFILKLDPQGNFIWVKTLAGNNQDSSTNANSISLNSDSDIIVSGTFEGTMDVNPGVSEELRTSNGFYDFFVVQLDAAGNFSWGNTHGGEGSWDLAYAANPDAQGNVYVSGSFTGTVDFDPGPDEFLLSTINQSVNVYLQKLDSEGNLLWVHIIGEPTVYCFAISYHMTVDEFDNPVLIIKFNGTLDFDPGPNEKNFTSLGSYDAAIVKLNPSGEFMWAGHMGGADTIFGLGIHSDKNGNLFTTGYFRGTIDLDPGQGILQRTSNGQKDIFVNKLRNPNLSVENPTIETGLVAFPNPTNGQLTLKIARVDDLIQVNLYNVIGQHLSSRNVVQTNEMDLEITGPSGVYFIEVITSSYTQTLRIIKK